MNRRTLVFVTALGALGTTVPSLGQDIPAALSGYRITTWAGGDGVTLGAVRSIAQDPNGYLWLASDAGLVRFDGLRFATADLVGGTTQLPASPTRAVYAARDGSLWTGYGNKQGVYRIVDGEVIGIFLKEEVAGTVHVIAEDRNGTIWIGHDEGLHRLQNGRWERIALPGAAQGQRVSDVHEDRAGTLWVASASGLYRRNAAGHFDDVAWSDGGTWAISEDANGRLWTTDETDGFRRADAPDHKHLFEARGINVFHDSQGSLWVTTSGQGIWRVQNAVDGATPTVSRATVRTGLVSDENSDILEDRDGNLWIASIEGLNRLTPHQITSLVDLGIVDALALGADGTAWAGTTTGLTALTGVTPRSLGTSRAMSSSAIRALHTASNGTLWAATDEGLHNVIGGRLVAVSLRGPPLRRITSIVSDRRGALWVCDEAHGLTRIANGRIERVAAAADDTSARPTFAHVDDRGRVWVAFSGGTVAALDHEGRRLEQYGPAEGLIHKTVNAIQHTRRGDVWIGGNGGLSRLRGNRFETLSFRDEVTWRPVAAVIDDEAGDLWVAFAFFGLIRIGVEDVARAFTDASYRPPYRVYNTANWGAGYPSASYNSSAASDRNNALWFLTSRGVTVVDPLELRTRDTAPGVPFIEGITADERRYRAAADTVLPARTNRLRIDYTVVNLSSQLDRIRFRYRLDGFDSDWVDGTGPRQAFYTNLPPGSYHFRLQASTNAARWNDAEVSWAFSIQPMFYQTRGFYVVFALGLVLCARGVWHLRMRQVRMELAAVFGERIRLSREIHDTLLQGLVGITLRLDAVSHGLEPASRTRARIVEMRKHVEDYIREVRQSIWDLRSPTLDTHGLVGALRATGDRLTAGKVGFEFTVTGTPRPCPSRIERHVLRIGHEAVVNAVRHANARQVHMEIGFVGHALRLRVADDGRGFTADQAPSETRAGHYGLTSMKERAADVGGRCLIESVPGSGVQVVAEFPLAPTG